MNRAPRGPEPKAKVHLTLDRKVLDKVLHLSQKEERSASQIVNRILKEKLHV